MPCKRFVKWAVACAPFMATVACDVQTAALSRARATGDSVEQALAATPNGPSSRVPDGRAPDGSALDGSALDGRAPDGRRLFNEETFLGNGRTCATCHIGDETDLDPMQAQKIYRRWPKDPLFRSIDSDDGRGHDYSLLLRDATFRIPFVLPPNVTVDERDDNVFEDAFGRTVVVLRRAVPSVRNTFFEDRLMYDGREGNDLRQQAISAVITHNEPGRLPTQKEAEAIADFQRELFTSRRLERFSRGGPAPELPRGLTAAQRRGRRFFEQVDAPYGLCAMCHSGPLLNTTNRFNPIEEKGQRFATNFSSELNPRYPAYNFRFAMSDGSVRTLRSSDPGRSIVTGDPCADDPAACRLNPNSTASIFKIPTLWGTPKTAPYFHDNSVKSLEELMVHYQKFFQITANGIPDPNFVIDDDEASDILEFLKLL